MNMRSPDDLLAEFEARETLISRREVHLRSREQEVEAELLGIEGRCRALQRRLRELEFPQEAQHLVALLPRLGPPPGVQQRERALEIRQNALVDREQSARARERALVWLDGVVRDATSRLNEATQRAQVIEEGYVPLVATPPTSMVGTSPPSPAVFVPDVDPGQAVEAEVAAVFEVEVDVEDGFGVAVEEFFVEEAETVGDEEQRRDRERRRLDCIVSLNSRDNFFSGFVRNISNGGLFIATFDLLPAGTEVDVCFTLPGGLSLRAPTIVRWVRELPDDADPSIWPGMGLEFVEIDAKARKAINAFMSLREPMFYVD